MSNKHLIAVGLVAALSVAGIAGAAGSRVVDAVKAGDQKALQALLKQRADVNAKEADGTTALHWAAQHSSREMVDLLIQAGADVKAANRYGVTPLTLAATNGDSAVIERLVKAGADANGVMADGQTVLMLAARTGKVDAIKTLVAHGASVNVRDSWMGETPLVWAAAENNATAVRALVELGAGVDARSATVKYPAQKPADPSNYVSSFVPKGQWTPLMYAAREGAADSARVLIELGANLNVQDPDGFTPLLEAIVNGHFDLAAALLEKGANPNLADSSGMAALYAAVDMRTPAWERSRPDPKETDNLDGLGLMKVLLDHGADPNQLLKSRTLQRYHAGGPAAFVEGTTPLMRASKYDNLDMVQLLVSRGANVSLAQADGTTALMLAAGVKYAITQEGDPVNAGTADDARDIVKLFIDRGADVNAANAKGETALYGAAFTGRNGVIQYLADHGARLDAKTKQGLTLLDGALNTGVTDDGTGSRVGGKPGDGTVALVRTLMVKAGIEPATAKGAVADVVAKPARQTPATNPAGGR